MQRSLIHALGSGGGGGSGARGAGGHAPPWPSHGRANGGAGAHKLGGLPFSAAANRSGMVSMTPRQFLPAPPHLPCAGIWRGLAVEPEPPPSPLLPALTPFLSPSDSLPRQLFPDPARTRTAHRHTQPRAPPARGHTRTHARRHARAHAPPPPAALHKQLSGAVSLLTLNYSCHPGGRSRWGGEHRYFLSIPQSDKTQDDAPERFGSLCCHQLFPRCCLLGQPVSRR